MALKLYNTMSRSLEAFQPLHGNRINMFVCGPTVYDHSHIGHARTYLAYDIIARYLRAQGYSLFFLMNVTDIDDKIINRGNLIGEDPLALADRFTRDFFDDMTALGMTSVNLYAKASEHIPEIISQISVLIEKGFAYRVDGDVYFEVPKFSNYGDLSHQNVDQLVKHRIDPDPRKRNVVDFVLWKAQKPGEPFWDSPWGRGRPGWHIEDTAITTTYLGDSYDIHGGGLDLIFPHHEAEIAQAEAATGTKPLVRYWLHSGLLMVEGARMGKSMGNYITIKDALRNHDAETLRLYYAMSHYRSEMDYRESNIAQAAEVLAKVRSVYSQFKSLQTISDGSEGIDPKILALVDEAKKSFDEAMNDDFNTPRALAATISFVKSVEPEAASKLSNGSIGKILSFFEYFGEVFGILRRKSDVGDSLERLVNALLKVRDDARRRNDWDAADRIRGVLAEVGVSIEDTAVGARWYRSSSKRAA